MIELDRGLATKFAAEVLETAGASAGNSGIVAEHLVMSDACGVHSHGLLRLAQYVSEMDSGEIDGRAVPEVARPSLGRVVVDGRGVFGQVAAVRAVHEASSAAEQCGVGLAATLRSGHAGRLGAYTEILAGRGLIAVAFCSGPRSGHRVAPYGGLEGRLSTNPISFAFATDCEPVVADFSTSTVPEGVVRRLRDLGEPAPSGSLYDAQGRATTDPRVLYEEPRGTIVPLGGERFGHKGYALGLLVEAMTTVLCGEDTSDPARAGNNVTLLAVDPDARSSGSGAALATYLRHTTPAHPDRPVLLPGDLERAARMESRTIKIDQVVREALEGLSDRFGVDLPHPP